MGGRARDFGGIASAGHLRRRGRILKPLNVGLIGCGWFASAVHLPILSSLRGVRLAAIADPDAEQREHGRCYAPAAVRCADYRDMLQMRELDAVVVATPPATHAEVAIAALQLGKHLYLEKPIAIDLDQGRQLLRVWNKAALVGMMGFNYRFNAMHQAGRALVHAGKLGPLVGVRTSFSTPERAMPEWKQSRSTGGGALLDLATHHVDLVRFLFGQDVAMVSAEIESRRSDHDTAAVQLRLADGLIVQSFFSLGSLDEDRIEIYGKAGKLTLDRYRSSDVGFTAAVASPLKRASEGLRLLRSIPHLINKLRSPWHEPSYRESLLHFVDAIRSGSAVAPDLCDGYRSLQVICAAEESARTGRFVTVAPLPSDF